ncbi:hypothetical protein ACQKQD_17960 [Methylobacterium sp. NPDC080182]|uniref:hypothetical protein n=1 Tax=Methylobacterium sp. NPDC080182 TaxID=3390590 RepID=UPI003D060224
MSDDLESRIRQLERDMALSQHNISQILQWIKAHITAGNTTDQHKTRADRRFLDMSVDVYD